MTANVTSITASALRAAERLLAIDPTRSIPVDVFALAVSQGIRSVKPHAMATVESARLVGLRHFDIYYNAAHSLKRQRFSICHEIAHTILMDASHHASAGLAIRAEVASTLTYAEEERLCDAVAEALLMPRDAFLSAAQSSPPGLANLEGLADKFIVSTQAALCRLRSLAVEWPCVLLRWVPVSVNRLMIGFRLIEQRPIGGIRRIPFENGAVAVLDGLFTTHRTLRKCGVARLTIDDRLGWRLENRAHRRGSEINVWSVATYLAA